MSSPERTPDVAPDAAPEAVPGTTSAAAPGPGAGATPTGPQRGVRALAGDEFSVAEAVGGWRGVVESGLPGLLFVVVFLVTRELTPALVVSVAAALAAVVLRLVQRTPPTQAFGGVLGIGIGAFWAWRTGDAENFFAWGLWVNVAWGLGALISILVGRPAVGIVVSLLRGEPMTWRTDARTDPAAAALKRRYTLATWIWVAVFGGRLAVQLPLYLQGTDAVGWLGTAKLVMGVPLFAVGLWLTWLLVGPRRAPAEPAAQPPTPPR